MKDRRPPEAPEERLKRIHSLKCVQGEASSIRGSEQAAQALPAQDALHGQTDREGQNCSRC